MQHRSKEQVRAGSTSEYLTHVLGDLDKGAIEDLAHEEREEAEEAEKFAKKLTGYLLRSLEAFGERTSTKVREMFSEIEPSLLENAFDDHYVRDMLERVPKMVGRTMKLSLIVPRKTPSAGTNFYLREATRSYIFGFWPGSVAFPRGTRAGAS